MPSRGLSSVIIVIAVQVLAFNTALAQEAVVVPQPPIGEWPQFGGTPHRNNSPANADKHVPTTWDVKSGKNIAWTARLGPSVVTCPVISGGRVLMGTSNADYIDRFKKSDDFASLLCFDDKTGEFLWQYSGARLAAGRVNDWPTFGMMSAPCVQGDRVWLLTNRCELVCLDLHGFRDQENDGSVTDESHSDLTEADVVWRLDLIGELGVHPHNVSASSPTLAGDMLLLNTGHGVDETHVKVPNPKAPSFIAVDKKSGKVIWKDGSPGANILHGQWSSPAWSVIDGTGQAIFAGGDGYVYSFGLEGMRRGETDLLWWFDANDKKARWVLGGRGTRNSIIAAPVIDGNRVLIAVGQDPEHGDGAGALWCIDATKRGDVSSELVYNIRDPKTAIPHRREIACDVEQGDFTRPNPNSGVIWCYRGKDWNNDGRSSTEEQFNRAVATPVVRDGFVVAVDLTGFVHCLDSQTGKPWWIHDTFANCMGTPVVTESNIFVADEDGDVVILKLAAAKLLVEEIEHDASFSGSLVSTGDAIYLPRLRMLIKVRRQKSP